MPLRVVAFFPEPAKYSSAPAAVLCQPFNDPPEYSRLLALELVQNGFVVVTFDWHGRTPEENRQLLRRNALPILRDDVGAAVAYLRSLPSVDPARVMLAGHSVGGTVAIEAAMADPAIAAVASIGMEADITPESPRNVLWAQGLYDEFRVLNRMRGVFQASAATTELENTTVGDFARGTARRLGVSPTADHFTELQDKGIQREVLNWFRQAAGLSPVSRGLRMETRSELWLLAWLAALLAAVATLREIGGGRRWLLRCAAGTALFGVYLLARIGTRNFLFAADGIFWLIVFALFAGFVGLLRTESLARGLRSAARLGLVAWASLLLTFAVNNVGYYGQHPSYLVAFPEFAVRHALSGVYAYLLVYARPVLFSVYGPDVIVPRVWVYAVTGLEIVFPGFLLGLAAGLFRPRAPGPALRQVSRKSMAILLVLTGILAGVAWLRFQQGFLTLDSALAALRYIVRFAVLPVLFFVLLWRWTGGRGAGDAVPTQT
jgi:dienelactone hydrolase